MYKKEIIGMLLAGGQGSRLGILSKNTAKPAIPFAGKYRIIDFTLSNCINSGLDTVGVLTQYQPLKLNQHIGIGISWDLDRRIGGVTVLPPHIKQDKGAWYSGTADAVYQNINYIEEYDPEYVLILSGDHIYKMDYSKMLEYHKETCADVTIGVLEVTLEEASRFGIMNTDNNDQIIEFEEKPVDPKSNLASMGIYIFNWSVLRKALLEGHEKHDCNDFGKHIIPELLAEGKKLMAHRFKGYWRDVGNIESLWKANMEMIEIIPEFNLYEEHWQIYTNDGEQMPLYLNHTPDIDTSIIAGGSEIRGKIINSVLGHNVRVEKGAVVKDSIIMSNVTINAGSYIDKAIICEEAVIGRDVKIGVGANVINEELPNIYYSGISVVADKAVVPDSVTIGKNCVISGVSEKTDYTKNELASGKTIVKGEVTE